MKRLFLLIHSTVIALCVGTLVNAQVNLQPTPPPLVTAESEPWYLNGEPVFYAGNLYYPTGPQIHFNGNEMVRSGFYQSIPLYTRTTIEPYSLVYVPLSGGLMQPYERRRAGDIAGTVGSTTPSFPVVSPSEQRASSNLLASVLPQAPAPPGLPFTRTAADNLAPQAQPPAPVVVIETVGTTGRAAPAPAYPASTAARPKGVNGIFVEFNNERWFSTGPARPFQPSQFTRVGEYHGFPVYTRNEAPSVTIYIPVVKGGDFVAAYARRRAR